MIYKVGENYLGDSYSTDSHFLFHKTAHVWEILRLFINTGSFIFQIRVRVQDGGNPHLADISTVIVSVNRNLFPPIFQPQQYSRTILDTQAIGVPLVTITANDQDTTVCIYVRIS